MHEHAPHRQRHDHGHGHAHDRGLTGALRYLRLLPMMWRSPVSEAVVDALAPRPSERVMDLGAGMGPATAHAARRGASVVAVDPTAFMRAVLGLRRRWPASGTVQVLDGAAESIPVADGCVDALWTVNTLHHWTDRPRACRELMRVLRPGGRVLLVDEDMDDPSHPWHERWRTRHARRHFDEVDPDVVAAELLAAGFTRAEGTREAIAGRPAKVIRATR